jgi:hypothetical protein
MVESSEEVCGSKKSCFANDDDVSGHTLSLVHDLDFK